MVVDDPLVGQQVEPPPSVEADGQPEYQVSSVEDSQVNRNQLHYLIRWTGYDSLTCQLARFVHGLQAIGECHPWYPQKSGQLENAPVVGGISFLSIFNGSLLMQSML
jgi:hypothetical protein